MVRGSDADGPVRVAAVDDHVPVRRGLAAMLADSDEVVVVTTAGTVDELLTRPRPRGPPGTGRRGPARPAPGRRLAARRQRAAPGGRRDRRPRVLQPHRRRPAARGAGRGRARRGAQGPGHPRAAGRGPRRRRRPAAADHRVGRHPGRRARGQPAPPVGAGDAGAVALRERAADEVRRPPDGHLAGLVPGVPAAGAPQVRRRGPARHHQARPLPPRRRGRLRPDPRRAGT